MSTTPYINEPLEEHICEIGSKMYHDKIMGDRSVDISSLMKGVFNFKTKPTAQRRRKKIKKIDEKKNREITKTQNKNKQKE